MKKKALVDLKYDPVSILGRDIHGVLSDHLLTLTQRDVVEVVVVGGEAELLSEFLDVLERVHAGRQDEEDGRRWTGLLVRLGELDAACLDVLGSQFLLHERP